MKVLCGSTRIVLLWGNVAVKIGRFRCFRVIAWILFSFFGCEWRKKFFKRYGYSFVEAITTYLMTGLRSNLVELEYSHSFPEDERIMPITNSFLGGWVIFQEKGEKITTNELVSEHPFASNSEAELFTEMKKVVQFCRRKNGKIVLVDYGAHSTCELLKNTLYVSA